jgi:pimeloyl-[acyl-carrier protein] methyl ester esterase
MSLFLIHGWATNATIWPEWLATGNAYCYQSPQYPNYSQLVASFIAYYNQQGQPLTVVGWSLGGMLALQLAVEHPEKINNLILLSSTPRFTLCDHYTAGLAPSVVRNLARKLAKNKWQTQLDFFQLMFTGNEHSSWKTFTSHLAPLLENISTPTLQSGLQYLLETDLRSLLPSIQIPCHILHGTEDIICPVGAGQYLASMLPNSIITLVPGAGHVPFYTQSEYCKSQLSNSINPT